MQSYLPFAVFAAVGALFVTVNLFIARLARPSAPTPEKQETYECGPAAVGDAWGRFNPRYYLFALLFVVFDVEAAFLFPWAVAARPSRALYGSIVLWEMLLFVGILLIGWAYAYRRGAMEWE